MKISEPDALLVLYLYVKGPATAYQIAKEFLSAGVLHEPRSGFPGVVRVVDSRLKRLHREGYLVKTDEGYSPTDMVIIDNLRVVGEVFNVDLGPCLVFHTHNGHHVVFEIDRLLEPLSDDAITRLFGLEQNLVLGGIKGLKA